VFTAEAEAGFGAVRSEANATPGLEAVAGAALA
jgi:hypothetical protein